MVVAENEKFEIFQQTNEESLVIYDKLYKGEVRLYVDRSDIDELVVLLLEAKKRG